MLMLGMAFMWLFQPEKSLASINHKYIIPVHLYMSILRKNLSLHESYILEYLHNQNIQIF